MATRRIRRTSSTRSELVIVLFLISVAILILYLVS